MRRISGRHTVDRTPTIRILHSSEVPIILRLLAPHPHLSLVAPIFSFTQKRSAALGEILLSAPYSLSHHQESRGFVPLKPVVSPRLSVWTLSNIINLLDLPPLRGGYLCRQGLQQNGLLTALWPCPGSVSQGDYHLSTIKVGLLTI